MRLNYSLKLINFSKKPRKQLYISRKFKYDVILHKRLGEIKSWIRRTLINLVFVNATPHPTSSKDIAPHFEKNKLKKFYVTLFMNFNNQYYNNDHSIEHLKLISGELNLNFKSIDPNFHDNAETLLKKLIKAITLFIQLQFPNMFNMLL